VTTDCAAGALQELEERKLAMVVDLQLARQQALDNPGDELCEKNANLIKTGEKWAA
jgi:hypothetical protein